MAKNKITQHSPRLRCSVALGAKGVREKSVDEREQIQSAGANLAGFHPVTKGDNRASKKERKTRALRWIAHTTDEQESNCQLA